MITILPQNIISRKFIYSLPFLKKQEVRDIMKKINLNWNIYNTEIGKEERYCHNCGKKVEFSDSLKRRQNANGKNIYYFAIYKCAKGHTWNKSLNTFKVISGLENTNQEFAIQETMIDDLEIEMLFKEGIAELEISLNVLEQKVRLDKFLSEKIKDVSRGKISRMISEGIIKVNSKQVESKTNLQEKDVIYINIKGVFQRVFIS